MNARIVEDMVEPAETVNGAGNDGAHLVRPGDIACHNHRLASRGSDHVRSCGQGRFSPPDQHDVGAFTRKGARSCRPDAAACAGDDRDLAGEAF